VLDAVAISIIGEGPGAVASCGWGKADLWVEGLVVGCATFVSRGHVPGVVVTKGVTAPTAGYGG
jgi:hypothetical protein